MVIFHSYVKLPEGNFRVVDNLESQTSHPTVDHLQQGCMIHRCLRPPYGQAMTNATIHGTSTDPPGGGWRMGYPPNPIGKDMIISQYFPLESCWGIPNS